jgi:hypothetical protein
VKILLLSLLVIASYACNESEPSSVNLDDGGLVPCGRGYCQPGTVCCPDSLFDGGLACFSDAGECCNGAACDTGEVCCGDGCMFPDETCCAGMTCPFEDDDWACPTGFSCNTETCCL